MKIIKGKIIILLIGTLFLVSSVTSLLYAQEKVTLKYTFWSGNEAEANELAARYEEDNPNINIVWEIYPYNEYWKKIPILLAAGTPPEVYDVCALYYHDLASRGQILDVTDLVERDLNMDDYFESVLFGYDWPVGSGNYSALGFSWTITVLYYNKSMFDARGVDYPNDSWSWQDLREAATRLTADTDGDGKIDQWGYQSTRMRTNLDTTFYSNGGRMLNPLRTESVLDQYPQNIETTQFFVDMIYKDKISPPPPLGNSDMVTTRFKTGKVGMITTLLHLIGDFREVKDFDWDIAMVPKGTVTRAIYGGADPTGISPFTEHKEEAWGFLKYLLSARRGMLLMTGRVPVNRKVANSDAYLRADLPPENMQVAFESTKYMRDADFSLKWSEWHTAMQQELDLAFMQEISVEEALQRATKAMNRVIQAD